MWPNGHIDQFNFFNSKLMNERLEFYWYSLNKIMDHIRFSDAKAALFLSIYGILISLFFTKSVNVWAEISEASMAEQVLLVITGVFSVISIYFAFNTVNPRLKNPTSTSIIYFGDVHKKFNTAEEYYAFGKKRFESKEEVFRDLSDQVYVNSTIAYKKFFNVSWALRFFVLSIMTFLLANLF